jgi:hypothetical protein
MNMMKNGIPPCDAEFEAAVKVLAELKMEEQVGDEPLYRSHFP